jgi:hypothetical protein
MDGWEVSFHTLDQKIVNAAGEEGSARPRKARVHVTRAKKTILVFFDAKGVIYANYISKGKTVNAEYVKKALTRILVVSRQKRPIMFSPASPLEMAFS